MAHRVGALFLPAPPPAFGPTRPDEDQVAIIDPALGILGAFFKAVLEFYCGNVWAQLAPGEPIVRTLKVGYDPEDLDFSDNDLPTLALWRENDGAPTILDDGNAQAVTAVSMLWVPSPADEQKLAARSPFYRTFTAALLQVFKTQRDPCWVRRGEENDPVSRTYGSWVFGLAGIDSWQYAGTRRTTFSIPVAGQRYEFPAFLATWSITESSESDPAAFGSTMNGERVGTEPTSIAFNLNDRTPTEDDPEVFTRQSALIPPGDDP